MRGSVRICTGNILRRVCVSVGILYVWRCWCVCRVENCWSVVGWVVFGRGWGVECEGARGWVGRG